MFEHRATWLPKRDLLYTPVPYIEILFCTRLLSCVLGLLSTENSYVGLMCDTLSVGIWIGFVFLVGYQLANFQFWRWRCKRYKLRKRNYVLLGGGNDVLLGRSHFIGGNNGCHLLAQNVYDWKSSCTAHCCLNFPPMLRERFCHLLINNVSLQPSCSGNNGDNDQPESEWNSLPPKKTWRPFFIDSPHEDEDDDTELEGFAGMLEPSSNTIERLEAQPLAILNGLAIEPRDKHA